MRFVTICLCLLILFDSCKKPDDEQLKIPVNIIGDSLFGDSSKYRIEHIYVMNEGTWQQNNASLTHLDVTQGKVSSTFFYDLANRKLGDVANDMIFVNQTLFVLVNASSTLEKIALKTGSVQQLKLVNFQQVGRQPRQMHLSSSGDLFISSFDDVVSVIDTATLSVKQLIRVGKDPEGLVTIGNLLFVANSGGLDFPRYDSTISVIDISNYTSLPTLRVGLNPGAVCADKYHTLYVKCSGNYDNVPSAIYVIDGDTRETRAVWNYQSFGMQPVGDSLFLLNAKTRHLDVYDTRTRLPIKEALIDFSHFKNISAMQVEPRLKLVFIADGLNYLSSGVVYAFDFEGNEKFHFDAGVIPANIAVDFKELSD